LSVFCLLLVREQNLLEISGIGLERHFVIPKLLLAQVLWTVCSFSHPINGVKAMASTTESHHCLPKVAGCSILVVTCLTADVRSQDQASPLAVLLSRQPLRYAVLGTGCCTFLQCLGRLSLPPSMGW